MKTHPLCRSLGVNGIRWIAGVVALCCLVALFGSSGTADAKQEFSAGSSLNYQDTKDNPLGDGGLRGEPDETETVVVDEPTDAPTQDELRSKQARVAQASSDIFLALKSAAIDLIKNLRAAWYR